MTGEDLSQTAWATGSHRRIESLAKLVVEGVYAAEVDVELVHTRDEWSPCLSLSDAEKLDAVRLALKRGDLQTASTLARVFELIPVAA
jgi:hypothetical protein